MCEKITAVGQLSTIWNGGSNRRVDRNKLHVYCYSPKYYLGPWKASLLVTLKSVRQQNSFLKPPHNHLGKRTRCWVGISHPLPHTASGKIRRYTSLLKTTLKASHGCIPFKHRDTYLAKATWLVNTPGSVRRAGPVQWNILRTIEKG